MSLGTSLSIDWANVIQQRKVVSSAPLHDGFNIEKKESFQFVTYSKYKGDWNKIGLSGLGEYFLPHKVEYDGTVDDSQFHGEGNLNYPMGHEIEGTWEKDKLVKFQFIFPDGLRYTEPWEYCGLPDRRFWIDIQDGLKSVCEERLTNTQPPREIPRGCYDTGDGFYNPDTKCVESEFDRRKVVRIPSLAEEKWIMENCRKAWDEPTGYRPDLYEQWMTGRCSDKYGVYGGLGGEEMEDEEFPKSEVTSSLG